MGGTVRWGCRGERLFLLSVYLRGDEVKSRTMMCPSLGVSIRFQAFGCLPAEQWYVCLSEFMAGTWALRRSRLEGNPVRAVWLCWLGLLSVGFSELA